MVRVSGRCSLDGALPRNWTLPADRAGRTSLAVACLVAGLLLSIESSAEERGPSPSAPSLLEQARKHRETLSPNFPGFRSRLVVHKDGAVHEGSMLFRPPITLEIRIDDSALRKSVKSTVRSLLMHRMPSNRSAGGRDEEIAFAEEDRHPLGRRILLGDKYGSSYRIRDDRILEVDRNMDDSRLQITVMETEETDSGKYLPTQFFVAQFDKKSGSVKQSSAYSDAYRKVGEPGKALRSYREALRSADEDEQLERIRSKIGDLERGI